MKWRRVTRFFDRILDTGAVFSAAMITFIMLAVCVEVAAREAFGEPLTWITDISSILLVYVTFLAVAWILRKDGHVKMEWLVNWLNPRQQYFLSIVTSIVCVIMCLVITWYGALTTWNFYRIGFYMPTSLETPKYIVLVIVPLGSLLLLIEFLRKTARLFRNQSPPNK